MRRVIVDLNYLFHRQQVERIRSDNAENEVAQKAHEELALRFEKKIEALTSADYRFPKAD